MKRSLMYYSLVSILLISGCKETLLDPQPLTEDLSPIINEIESVVWALHSADTSMNAEGVIDLMWPDATMLIDGNRMTYKELAEGSRTFMKELTHFHAEWNDLQILPVSENAAISSYIFVDSIVNNQGTIMQSQGPNTFMWLKRNDKWKIIFGDADHYPLK